MNTQIEEVLERVVAYPSGHMRVLGPPGSGKTSLLLKRFEVLKKRGEKAVVITYSRESKNDMVAGIIPAGSAGFGSPPVYTYNNLAKRILEKCSPSPPKLLSEFEETILVEHLIIENASCLKSDYRNIYSTERFRKKLGEFFHICLQNGCEKKHAAAIMNEGNLDDTIFDLFLLYEKFLEALEKWKLASFYNISHIAANALKKNPKANPFADIRVFIIEDFHDIDRGQFELVTTLAPPKGGAALNVFGDPTGARFGFRGTQHHILTGTFPKIYNAETFYLPARMNKFPILEPALKALLKETTGEEAKKFLLPGRKGEAEGNRQSSSAGKDPASPQKHSESELQVLVAEDEFVEASVVASIIKRLLDEQRCKPEEIAVAVRDKSRYMPVIASTFRQHGIPLETGRTEHNVFRDFLISLLKFLMDPNDEIALSAISISPLRPALELVLSQRKQNKDEGTGGEISESLRDMASELAGCELSSWLQRIIGEVVLPAATIFDPDKKDMALQILSARILDDLNKYMSFVKTIGRRPDAESFLKITAFFTDEFGSPARNSGRVGLYSCRELSGRFFPVVCVMGCSETVFPKLEEKDQFIPWDVIENALKAALPASELKLYQARPVEKRLSDEYGLLFHSFARAERILVVTAPRRIQEEEYLAPCDILKESLKPVIEAAEEHFAPLLQLSKLVPGGHLGGLTDKLSKFIPSAPLWTAGPSREASFKIPRFPLSSSSLRTYSECERKFFYQKVLGIPEREMIYMKLGSLFHSMAEELARRYPSRKKLIEALAGGAAKDISSKLLGNDEDIVKSSLLERLLARILDRLSESLLAIEASREGDYVIEKFEEFFGFSYAGFDFSGVADRVDCLPGGRVRLIDYKTGSDVLKTGRGLRGRVATRKDGKKQDWQIPLYSWWVYDSRKLLPEGFSYYYVRPGEEPVMTTLLFFDSEEECEASSEIFRGRSSRFSYLLKDELEQCMEQAVGLANSIFSTKKSFERTTDRKACQFCPFRPACKRSEYVTQ